jgi:hypothetical protein
MWQSLDHQHVLNLKASVLSAAPNLLPCSGGQTYKPAFLAGFQNGPRRIRAYDRRIMRSGYIATAGFPIERRDSERLPVVEYRRTKVHDLDKARDKSA